MAPFFYAMPPPTRQKFSKIFKNFFNLITCHAMTQRYKILHGNLADIEALVNGMVDLNQNWVPLGPVVKDKPDLWVQVMVRHGHGAGRYDRIVAHLRGSSLD